MIQEEPRTMSRGSSSRSSSCTRRYRLRAPTSQVDETLFGSNVTPPKSSQLGEGGKSAPRAKKQSQKNQEGEIIQIITKDFVRTLRIPFKDPPGESIILPPAEFEQITSTSRFLTKKEREALREAHQKKKEEEIRAAEEEKRRIHEADMSRQENQAPSELEVEARDRELRLVERANALRMEQEDEIKKLNSLILGAKCQATRDAQMHEKKQIQAELSEEEKRLDAMMEVDRRKAMESMEQMDELRKQDRISGKQEIYDQIQKHLEEKQVQDEYKEHEKQLMQEKQEKRNLEDLQALEKKIEEQQRLQQEIRRINTETVQAKEKRREEEMLADERDMEYLRNKMEREAEYEKEQRKIKKEKELEIARLRALQEKAKDYKAEQDELRARRNRESADREWRRKEKERVAKKAQDEAMLRVARSEQVQCKEHFLSIEAGREKAEFERVLKAQLEAISKEKEEEEKQHQRAMRHAEAIRNQVKERELSAKAKRREIFKEAEQLVEDARQRRARLDEIKEKKLKELKSTGLSEKYCSDVERKAQAIQALTSAGRTSFNF